MNIVNDVGAHRWCALQIVIREKMVKMTINLVGIRLKTFTNFLKNIEKEKLIL